METRYEIEHYTDENGRSRFSDWLKALQDTRSKRAVLSAIDDLSLGKMGKVKNLKDGLNELKIGLGPGYRVYFTIEGDRVVILLCGGHKNSQDKDIKQARKLLTARRNDYANTTL